jgi:multidrug efflux pump subunit AcrA (membrane-fusion protein)
MAKLIILISIISFSFCSCKSKQESTQPVEEKITESVYASGILKSKNQYEVFSTVNGLVAEIVAHEGDIVKKGDAVIRLTNTAAKLNTANATIAASYASTEANSEKLNELKINIDQAKVKLDNDALLLQRQQNLWAQQIGTKNELEQRALTFKASESAWQAARLRYTELEKQISFQEKQSQTNLQLSQTTFSDYTIKSETDGKVYSILKEPGEMVNTQTAVALIGDAVTFITELQVDEYDIARIKPGQKVLLTMDSYKGQVFEGVITKIDPAMNERSKSFTVEASFVQQPPALYPKLTCEANIIIQTKEKALTIPANYLLEGDMVLLKNNEKRKVTTGLKDYEKVEILNGLTVNDIILKPQQ